MAQAPCALPYSTSASTQHLDPHDGVAHEGDEGRWQQGHEVEAREHHREGEACPGSGAGRQEAEDHERAHQGEVDEEQVREDRVEDRLCRLKEEVHSGKTIKTWVEAVKAARKSLSLTGFVAITGKSAQGKALYAKTKSIVSA